MIDKNSEKFLGQSYFSFNLPLVVNINVLLEVIALPLNFAGRRFVHVKKLISLMFPDRFSLLQEPGGVLHLSLPDVVEATSQLELEISDENTD